MSKKILEHFKEVDPVLYKVAKVHGVHKLTPMKPEKYFERLCRAITGQQLSVKASATIWGRFEKLLPRKKLTPKGILKVKHEDMRAAGMSNAKGRYIQGIAKAYDTGEIDFPGLAKLPNKEVMSELVKLKGVGQWTAEMFLMFTLGRPDVFSTGDLGLKRAMEKLYKLRDPSEAKMNKIARKWSPYRTYACRVLWDSLDNEPGK